ncbi:probable cytochrome P450 28d1 isoform X1 [Lucilia cuprina]|uniref:probable cytochrome P450 28d1 isoform X1 n=1 Tax=Lucilia cuprina TaxID=7375 RepID=UPI001F0563D5|nr:probable cytochrome P450 28d1 isoform X1 [Lucilia cuprina]
MFNLINFIFVIITTILSVLLALYVYLTWHFDYWIKRKIPGPKPRVLYGTFPGTIDGKRNFIYDLDEIYRQFKNKAKFVGVFMTRSPQLMILDPELCKEILITNFKCFQENESSIRTDRVREPISGSNPFVLPFDEWKVKRAEIVPGVTSSKIKGMFPIIENVCTKFRLYLKNEIKNGTRTFNAKEVALKYTGDVVADVVWGIDAENLSTTKDVSQKKSSIFNMSKTMIAQNFHAFNYYFIARIFPIIRRFYYVRFFPEITDRYFTKLSRSAVELRQAQENNSRQDFLQYIVDFKEKKNISDTQITAHNLTFLFDGFETSATLISHCLLLLARYPLAQQKLRQEIQQHHHLTLNSTLNFDDLVKLPYLEQCVAETLRIFTPLPFMAKVCTQPCEFTNNDGVSLQIQPGDICLISLHSMHHDEEFFPQPEEFMPERFAEENGGTKKYKGMGVYLPFGDGPRICLGMKFALTQAKAAIVEVIKHFELTVNERTRQDNYQSADSFMSGLDGGIYLDVKEL